MPIYVAVYVGFGLITLVNLVAWRVTGSEFLGGLFGNMLAGLITLISVNLIFDAFLEKQRKPGVSAAMRAASEVHGNGVKLICGLYGAAVRSGRVPKEVHDAMSRAGLDMNMAAVLSSTPLRELTFDAPTAPAIMHMATDARTVRVMADGALASHGQYLTPETIAAIFDVSRSGLVSFILTCVDVGAIPEFFSEEEYRAFFEAMNALKAAVTKSDPKLGERLSARGYLMTLDQLYAPPPANGQPTSIM